MKPESYGVHAEVLRPAGGALRFALDLLELIRPRIAVFVVYAAFTGGLLAVGPEANLALVLEAALYVCAVAGASSVFNQVLERETDLRMGRTASRPLPAQRMSVTTAVLFGALLGGLGTVGLALRFNLLAALFGLATFVTYVLVYTPLKRQTTFNTVVGALPGAMPPLLGYVALAGAPGPWGWMLFAVLFAWQFPHFFAIAWLNRADYQAAGMRMLSAVPGSEGTAGRQALAYSLLGLPVSLVPCLRGDAGPVYGLAACALGLAYVVASARFAMGVDERSARRLLLTSLVYLPLLLSFVLLDPVVSRVLS